MATRAGSPDRKLQCDSLSHLPTSSMIPKTIRRDLTRPSSESESSDESLASSNEDAGRNRRQMPSKNHNCSNQSLKDTLDVASLLDDKPGLLDSLDHQKVLQSYLGSSCHFPLPDPKKRSFKLRFRDALKMQARSALDESHERREARRLPLHSPTPPPVFPSLTRHSTSTPSMMSSRSTAPAPPIRPRSNPSLVATSGPPPRRLAPRVPSTNAAPSSLPHAMSCRELSTPSSCASSTCSSSVSANSFSTAGNSCVSSATSHAAAYTPLSASKRTAHSPTTTISSPRPTHSLSSTLVGSVVSSMDASMCSSAPLSSSSVASSAPSPPSRFMAALQRWRPTPRASANSVAPDSGGDPTTHIKMAPSKSSLADKIKTRLQLEKKKVDRISRSVSLSSLSLPSTRTTSVDPLSKKAAPAWETQPQRGGILKTNKNYLAEPPRTQFSPRPSGYASVSITDLRTQRETKRQGRVKADTRRRLSPLGGKRDRVKFAAVVAVRETFGKEDYDRGSDPEAVCTRLTSIMAQQIKEELNAYKLHEMKVHDQSRTHTHFFL